MVWCGGRTVGFDSRFMLHWSGMIIGRMTEISSLTLVEFVFLQQL